MIVNRIIIAYKIWKKWDKIFSFFLSEPLIADKIGRNEMYVVGRPYVL